METKKVYKMIDDLAYSDEYMNFIMNNCHGDRVICNGDLLLQAAEDLYLFNEFLASIGVTA